MSAQVETIKIDPSHFNEIIRNLREALKLFPAWKAQLQSSERKIAIRALRQLIDYLRSDIAIAAEAAGVEAGQMSYWIYQPVHFSAEEWKTLLEVIQFVNENREEVFHKSQSSQNKREKLKV